jgi:predicted transglutaminase-like cysteine proteinase
MGFFVHAHALRASVLASGLAGFLTWSIPATQAVAGTFEVSGSLELSGGAAEPFGLSVTPVSRGGLLAKWQGVARKIDDDRVQLALCDGDRERCVSDAALKLLAIIDSGRAREGRARLGEINRAINLAIHPMTDLAQFNQIDVWSSPLDTFGSGAGDCEDYAIAKYVALRVAGIPADDMRIVVMADTMRGEGHAVAAVRLDGQWLMLDNQRMAMVEDVNVRHYRPLFVIGDSGLMRYSDAPLLAKLQNHDPAPSELSIPAPRTRLIAASD